jgi:hypothetical protein
MITESDRYVCTTMRWSRAARVWIGICGHSSVVVFDHDGIPTQTNLLLYLAHEP